MYYSFTIKKIKGTNENRDDKKLDNYINIDAFSDIRIRKLKDICNSVNNIDLIFDIIRIIVGIYN